MVADRTDAVTRLERRLGYQFRDPAKADLALRHRSAGSTHNERLEFLGDAMIGLAVAEMLYAMRPELDEGDLTRMRASLVNGRALASMARELELGELLTMGTGERHGGGFQRRSTLADGFEAVIGAVFLDAGYVRTHELLKRLFAAPLEALPDPEQLKDPKTRLQELLQGRGLALPAYSVVGSSGPDHAREFRAECRVPELALAAHGRGSSRRAAEQAAAAEVISRLPFPEDRRHD